MSDDKYTIISYPALTLPDTYRAMVFSKWLRSLRYGNDYFRLIDQDVYFSSYHTYLSNLLSSSEAIVRLAVLPDDTDIVLGFSVYRGGTLDYVHVHRDYRRTGIGSRLLPSDISSISHVTKNGISFWTATIPNAIFNPFA
jgi:GNAT superfamily N-acetyltransferase